MDISRGEHVEKELDLLITRRDAQRRQTEGERRDEEFWRESESRYEVKRREEMRLLWLEFHREQAERARRNLEALIARHEAAAEMLESDYHKESA